MTKEELNQLKEEYRALSEKLKELSDEELKEVTGGLASSAPMFHDGDLVRIKDKINTDLEHYMIGTVTSVWVTWDQTVNYHVDLCRYTTIQGDKITVIEKKGHLLEPQGDHIALMKEIPEAGEYDLATFRARYF